MPDGPTPEFGNQTADSLGGERIRENVGRAAASEIGPLGPSEWAAGAAIERMLVESPADPLLLQDLADFRDQAIEPR